MKKFFTIWMLCLLASIEVTAQTGGISGTVLDEQVQPIAGTFVEVAQGGIKKSGTVTDEEGNYILKPLTPGRHDVTVKFVGYKESKTERVIVSPDRNTTLNIRMEPLPDTSGFTKEGYMACGGGLGHRIRLVSEKTITAAEIEKLPTRTLKDSIHGNSHSNKLDTPKILEHYRTGGSAYIVDGIRIYSPSNNKQNTPKIKKKKGWLIF